MKYVVYKENGSFVCIVLFSYYKTPGYRLVLIANRDEFYARPTASLSLWGRRETILGGRDLEAGGTWLGINTHGKLAVLTNYRETQVPGTFRSRGEIVRKCLEQEGQEAPLDVNSTRGKKQYRGFNLLYGDSAELRYCSNRSRAEVMLKPGIYGLSNHLLDTAWPKVVRGKLLLESTLAEYGPDPQALFKILEDTHQPGDDQLPDTGVGLEWEKLLAPIFIRSRNYGTRSSAVLLVDDTGRADFWERSFRYDERGLRTSEEKHHILE